MLNLTDYLSLPVSDDRVKVRDRIGCSLIGHPCDRLIWYHIHGQTPTDQPTRQHRRMWERGFWEEERVKRGFVDSLGANAVLAQIETQSDHLKGYADFVIFPNGSQEAAVLVEVKTTNEKTFNRLKRFGVLRTKLSWYIQAQCYLAMLKLETVLFYVVNRNTEEEWQEAILVDPKTHAAMEDKALRIKSAPIEPLGLTCNLKPEMECYGCPFRSRCWPEQFEKSVDSVMSASGCVETEGGGPDQL